MKQYKLLYNKTNLIIIAMIAIPLALMGVLFAILFSLPKETADWIIWLTIFSGLIIIFLCVLWVLTKAITIPCLVSVNDTGISFNLERKSLFYSRYNFFSSWDNVSNISQTFGNGSGNFFYRVSFKDPNFTANFSPRKGEEIEAEDFYAKLSRFQEQFNQTNSITPIASKSFYDTKWARAITWLFYATVIVVITLAIFKTIDWLRTISFLAFGFAWVANYYRNTKKLY